MPDTGQLKYLQSLPLEEKIQKSVARIIEWYEAWGGQVAVSFSGGKDSTVLLNLVRKIYPEVPACFSDTGLEFPEIREFVKSIDNVIWVKPKLTFAQVIEKLDILLFQNRTLVLFTICRILAILTSKQEILG